MKQISKIGILAEHSASHSRMEIRLRNTPQVNSRVETRLRNTPQVNSRVEIRLRNTPQVNSRVETRLRNTPQVNSEWKHICGTFRKSIPSGNTFAEHSANKSKNENLLNKLFFNYFINEKI